MPLYLRTLGGLWLEGSEFRRPKPLLLLTYLALEGSQPRRRLAELFFMDASDQMNSLSRALSYLRQEVPGVIEADNKKVWTTVSCDAAELLNLTDSKQLEKCLELYKGGFGVAVDYNLELGGELEEWFYGTREILAAKARQAFLMLGETEASKGNFAKAAHLAEKAYRLKEAAELEPDDFGRLYNLLYAGNSPLAAEVRKEAEGFEIPLELSREEAKAQLSETSETIRETANNLPLPKSSFVGRDQELVAIATQLAKPDCRLLTLHGTGGVGKSRLALQAAYDQLKGGGWEGVYFVALDALNSHELIGSSIAEALGLELQGQDDTLTQVQRFISKKHLLFVLDNYEHLIAGATLTSKLLASCPHLKLLVTSRERLNVEEEWVLTLEGLTVPEATPDTLNEAQHFEAVDMFLQRAKRGRLDFTISEQDLPHVLKICRLVDGLPLGIELAAVWVKTLPVAEIAKEIESNLNILETPSKNVAERHQSIRAAFEHSWKLLTNKEQEVLRKLSVFVGGFRREAASEVTGATLPILASLVDKSLLRVSESGRYDRHVLIFDYARDKLKVNLEETREIQRKYCDYYLSFIQQSRKIGDFEEATILKTIGEEYENIKTVCSLCKGETLLELVLTITPYHERRGLWRDALDWSERALSGVNSETTPIKSGELLHNIGILYRRFGEYDKAFNALSKSLGIKNQLNDKGSLASTHMQIGWFYYRLNNAEKAKYNFYLGEEIGLKIENPVLVADANHGLGLVAIQEEKLELALSYLQKSWELTFKHDNQTNIARVTDDLGLIHSLLGNKNMSIGLYKQAEDILIQLGNKGDLLINHYDLAQTYCFFEEYENAMLYYQKLVALTATSEYKHYLSRAYAGMAECKLAKENFVGASEYAMKALITARDFGLTVEEGIAQKVIGDIYLAQGHLAKAKELLESAIRLLGEGETDQLKKVQSKLEFINSEMNANLVSK